MISQGLGSLERILALEKHIVGSYVVMSDLVAAGMVHYVARPE